MFDFQLVDIEEESEFMYRQYLDAGIRIIPLHKIIKTNDALKCGCGKDSCETVGKHPVSENWQNSPFWDDEQLATMRSINDQLHPAFGALVRDGLLVVDVDQRNGGAESLARLEKKLGIDIKEQAGFAVRSGSGGKSAHYYFRSAESLKLKQTLPEYPGLDFKSSGYVVGCGSPHASGNDYEKLKGFPDDIGLPPAELIDLLQQKNKISVVVGGVSKDITSQELAEVTAFIDASQLSYEEWLHVGMALHYETGGSDDGLTIWDNLSASDSARYNSGECDRKWHGFGKSSEVVTYGTLAALAKRFGYVEPVTFDSEKFKGISNSEAEKETENLDVVKWSQNVKPWNVPGFAGEVYKWIDGQCRYPRKTIAAGATLYALSCLGGMRHVDARDGLPLNIMIFSVAGTGTGKESLNQAVIKLLSSVGISSAMHGKIKSEQEVYRNLLRNKAAFYHIDEIGILLQKINQAIKTGGASYLIGVIGVLMEAYSSAEGKMLVTGDMKEEIKDKISTSIAQINKKIDKLAGEGKGEDPKLEAERMRLIDELNDADQGLDKPFLSLLGYTTPTTFDNTITSESAENGFIARSIILREQENNPMIRSGFVRQELSSSMLMRLNTLYYGGRSDADLTRVDQVGELKEIVTDSEASRLLDQAMDYFYLRGEILKNTTGFEGIARRGWETCSKISLILAMADGGIRTPEHVLYAFAMAKEDNSLKIEYAYSDNESAENSLAVRLLSRLSFDEPLTRGQVNRLLKSNMVGTQEIIDKMVESGDIKSEKKPNATGKIVEYLTRLR